jgi:hypothetical protein
MSPGNLIKHRKNNSTALVINILTDTGAPKPECDREWAVVLFTGDSRSATVPYKLLKENWKVINEKL